MPIIKSAIKRMRQTAKRRARNISLKRDIKAAVKVFSTKPSATALSAAQSELDTAVKKGLIKKNTAARRKANLAKAAKAAGVKLEGGKAKTAAKTAAKPAAKAAPKAASKPAAKKATTKAADKAPAKKAAAKKPVAKKTTKKAA